jgi:glycerol-3-phosphate O-acyltransferase
MPPSDSLRPAPGSWPAPSGERAIFLLDASSGLERRLLEQWIERGRPADWTGTVDQVRIPASRARRAGRLDPRLEPHLAEGDDPVLAPLRVAWRAPERDGQRSVRFRDLLGLRDPRDPGRLRQHWVFRRQPERCWVIAAEPARLSELRQRWRGAAGVDATMGLAEFVARQAALALERAERRVRGARYKVPRFVREEILLRPSFGGGMARLAAQLDRREKRVRKDALRYLREIAATHSTYVIDLVARIIRLIYSQGYSEVLRYDRSQLEQIHGLTQRNSVVFLPSHKSNLDHLVLKYALYETGHPPNHTAGGINMNFFPVGPLIRRSGVFFIRRSFKDNEIYKFVLRQYIDYLVEKRFPLEWYLEGGRSRSGKLLPPRFGMLAYVLDAYRRGKSEDVFLIPVSVAYDQITDVGSYVVEQRGGSKERESFAWFMRFVRSLRRRYGAIHIRFGEPLSVRAQVGPPDSQAEPDPDERDLELQKLAFEVSVRINRVTPLTPTSMVTLALLGSGDKALTLDEIERALANLVTYVRRRKLPVTEEIDLDTREGIQRVLDALCENDVVTCFDEGPEAVYAIGTGQHLAAAYYRNAVIHFFLNGAIAELALLKVTEGEAFELDASAARPDPEQVFWDEAYRLRNLLKFEFFFPDRDAFRTEVQEELALHDPAWRERLARGGAEVDRLLRRFKPFSAHRVLRPFLEAYQVVGDSLECLDPEAELDESAFLKQCLALGRQYRLQRRIGRAESVSRVLFQTALKLARNRGLTEAGDAELARERRAFADELRDVLRRVDAVDTLAAARRAGLIN